MKIINLTHCDLDGVVSSIVLKNAIPKNLDFEIACTGYLSLTKKIKQLEPCDYLFITDLNLDLTQVELLKTKKFKRLFYFDHHITSPKALEVLQELNSKIIIDDLRCGSKITFDYFSDRGIDFLEELVETTNQYDLWSSEIPEFTLAVSLNDLFWNISFNKFYEDFKHGLIITDEHKQMMKRIEIEKQEYMKNSFDKFSTIEDNILIVTNPVMKFSSYFTLFYPNFQFYFILKNIVDDYFEFSFRIRNSNLTVPDIASTMQSLFPSITAGGHAQAGGFGVNKNDIDDFFNEFVRIFKTDLDK